ncbi:MAG: Immunoglobulin I-set domain protein [Herbinix sp.]|nr:Immunoglobulin I-set domain protein [Herbinix sp.]
MRELQTKTAETVQKLKAEGKDTARIVIPDARDEVSETNIYIPTTSLGTLSKGNINLQIDTEEAKINLSKESMKSISRSMTDDLYFRLVPVKNETEKEAVSSQAKMNAVLISNNKNVTATVIGNPVTIETNMPSAETIITLPLTGISIPTKATDREALLKQLAVYIEHSDGDKELVQGELVEYKKGQYGISFSINKFSTFTVVKTDAFLKSTEKAITKITAPANAVIKGSNITATVANEISSITVKVKVSDKAAWKLYLDKDLKKEAVNGKLKLTTGVNTSYIKVTAQDKSTKLYKLTITRNKSSMTEITKVILNENTVIKGSTITATVANEKTSLIVKAQVSNNASYKLYSDKSLKKEISNHKLNLKVGINTIYLKVTAENEKTTKVYTLKITRKGQEYKSNINLGLIGSEKYANIVARIFKQEYDTANVKVTSKGKYYLVTMSFKDRAAAKKACKDMIRRQYIVNYYFN